MKKFTLFIVLIWSVLQLVYCIPRRRKSGTIQTIHNHTGEIIAVDNLIQEFEREHRKFYEKEINNGGVLMWPALENKNLSDYCRKFVQSCGPARTVDDTVGVKVRKKIKYEKENSNVFTEVVVVQCNVMAKCPLTYYMTRAPELNCVYAVKCKLTDRIRTYTIINKYCNFEDKPLILKPVKRERAANIAIFHHSTGQPIAKGKYLMKYELEHYDLVKREGNNGEYIDWPHAIAHSNLNSYCYQYMNECAPSRNKEDITGSWKTEKLLYKIINIKKVIHVTVVKCVPSCSSARCYYISRAPETNCAYALIRHKHNTHSPFNIIFKHCNFENAHYQQTMFQDYNILDDNVVPKTEIEEKIFDVLET